MQLALVFDTDAAALRNELLRFPLLNSWRRGAATLSMDIIATQHFAM